VMVCSAVSRLAIAIFEPALTVIVAGMYLKETFSIAPPEVWAAGAGAAGPLVLVDLGSGGGNRSGLAVAPQGAARSGRAHPGRWRGATARASVRRFPLGGPC
jgi:hypothetical protein